MKKFLKIIILISSILILFNGCKGGSVISKNGKLSISSNPSGAKVYIDNEYKGITPLEIELMPKSYELKLTKDGYKDYSKSINIEANKTVELSIVLEKEQPQSIFEGKWELISYKGKDKDVSIIGFEGTLFNFFENGSLQNTKILYYHLPIEHSGEYKIVDDSHIKLIYELGYSEIYKFYTKNIDDINFLFLSDENDTFTVVFAPYTEFDYDIDDILEHILGEWFRIYDEIMRYTGSCNFFSFDENYNFIVHCKEGYLDELKSFYESYSFENEYLYLNIFNKSKKIKCKVKELSLSRLMLQDDKGNSALFIRSYEFEYFETTEDNNIHQIYSQIHSDLRTLCNALLCFELDWGRHPIQTTALRLSEDNAGAELLGNDKAKINIKGKKSLTNEYGPIKYIGQLPIDPLSQNKESYYYQSNSDSTKFVIYSYDSKNGKYIYNTSDNKPGESNVKPTP